MPNEYPTIKDFGLVGDLVNNVIGSPLASAATIAPIRGVHHVTGTAAIVNITVPWEQFSGTLFLIADGLWSWTSGGNINAAGSIINVGDVLVLTYDNTNAKWYPQLNTSSGGGGAISFSALTSGTNTTAAMVVDTGASLSFANTAVLTVAAGTVGAVSLKHAGAAAGTGYYARAVSTLNAAITGTAQYDLSAGVMRYLSTMVLGWASGDPTATASDVGFNRGVANVLVLNNGTANTTGGWLQQRAGELALNADYTNATATFSNTNLSATVISGRTYTFECCLFFSDSTAADGAQFDFNGGSAAATNFRAQAFAYNNVGGALVLTNGASTALNTAIQVTLALTTQSVLVVKGTFVPSGAGTFIVRAAQTAHTAGTLTVNRGSYLNIRDANPL